MSVNPVGTWQLPDADTQDSSTYKINIENCLAVAERISRAFAPHQQTVVGMTVRVDPGFIFDPDGPTLTEVSGQNTSTITAPVENPRIDRVVIDAATGTVSVITGTEDASPSPPSIPTGKLPVAQVRLEPTSLVITNSMITDERVGALPVTATKTVVIPHTWAVPGEIKVPSGDTDFIVPFFVPAPSGQTVTLIKARHVINSGTSVTAKLQKNGSDISGWTSINVTTTATTTDGTDTELSDGDKLALVVTAVSGTPKNMTFTVWLKYEV